MILLVLCGVIAAFALVFLRTPKPFASAAEQFAVSEVTRVRLGRERRIASLEALSPRDCELAIARLFAAEGWDVRPTGAGADEGIDIVCRKGGQMAVVEVKRYASSNRVGRPALMKFHSASLHAQADLAIFVTTSGFTEPAKEFALQHGILLVNREDLAARLARAFPDVDSSPLRAMCGVCGTVAPFTEPNEDYQFCSCGGRVRSPLPDLARAINRANTCPECRGQLQRVKVKHMRAWRIHCVGCGYARFHAPMPY